MSKEKLYAICGQLDDTPIYTKGIKEICVNCESIVWLSDSTVKAMKGRQFDVICHVCFAQEKKYSDIKLQPNTKEQKEEIFNITFRHKFN